MLFSRHKSNRTPSVRLQGAVGLVPYLKRTPTSGGSVRLVPRRSNMVQQDATGGLTMYQRETQQRMTVHDAARALGVSEDAVRMRVKRGKLKSDKEDGRLYVLLDVEPTSDPTGAGLASELIEELRSRVSYLEGIISTRDEEIRRRDVIISQLTERIPAIEAPQEARKSP